MTSKPHASVFLADIAQNDRGKMNILGAGWSTCSPGQRLVQTIVVLQVPWPSEDEQTRQVETTVSLWKIDQYGSADAKPVTTATVEGTLERPDDPDVPFPANQTLLDVPLLAELRPETIYLVDVSLDGEPTGWAPFQTRPFPEDE